MVSRPNQINLHLAITNKTGDYVNLVQYAEDSSATINPEALKSIENPTVTPK